MEEKGPESGHETEGAVTIVAVEEEAVAASGGSPQQPGEMAVVGGHVGLAVDGEIGRASCRERVFGYV